jgi:hypothetical protein
MKFIYIISNNYNKFIFQKKGIFEYNEMEDQRLSCIEKVQQ